VRAVAADRTTEDLRRPASSGIFSEVDIVCDWILPRSSAAVHGRHQALRLPAFFRCSARRSPVNRRRTPAPGEQRASHRPPDAGSGCGGAPMKARAELLGASGPDCRCS